MRPATSATARTSSPASRRARAARASRGFRSSTRSRTPSPRRSPNTAMVFVPARFAADAIYEAVDAGIETVICITEGIPAHDMLRVYNYVRPRGVTLIGPNCPGVLSPGKANVGIIPAEIFSEGPVGLVSRSGTLTYQIGHELTQQGVGQSTIVGIGGDPVVGSSFIDVLTRFNADPETEIVVMVGEIGGAEEEKAAAFIGAEMTKPVVAYIAGFTAPPGKTMGHAGRDHLRQRRHGAGQEGRARGEGSPGRNEPDRGRPAGGRGRRDRRLRQGRPGAPKSARASEVVYGVKVLEKMLEGPPPRVDPQAVAKSSAVVEPHVVAEEVAAGERRLADVERRRDLGLLVPTRRVGAVLRRGMAVRGPVRRVERRRRGRVVAEVVVGHRDRAVTSDRDRRRERLGVLIAPRRSRVDLDGRRPRLPAVGRLAVRDAVPPEGAGLEEAEAGVHPHGVQLPVGRVDRHIRDEVAAADRAGPGLGEARADSRLEVDRAARPEEAHGQLVVHAGRHAPCLSPILRRR